MLSLLVESLIQCESLHAQELKMGEQLFDYALLRNRKVASILVTVKCTRHYRAPAVQRSIGE